MRGAGGEAQYLPYLLTGGGEILDSVYSFKKNTTITKDFRDRECFYSSTIY